VRSLLPGVIGAGTGGRRRRRSVRGLVRLDRRVVRSSLRLLGVRGGLGGLLGGLLDRFVRGLLRVGRGLLRLDLCVGGGLGGLFLGLLVAAAGDAECEEQSEDRYNLVHHSLLVWRGGDPPESSRRLPGIAGNANPVLPER
jgi:hypothetical protein